MWRRTAVAGVLLSQRATGQTRVSAPPGHTEGAAPARSGGAGWPFALGVASGGGLLVHALASHAAAPSPVRWLRRTVRGELRRTVRGELWLAGEVLLAAALLSKLPPGTDVESHAAGATAAGTGPAAALGLQANGTDYTTTVRVTLQATPGAAGPNRFLANVEGPPKR